MIFSLTILHLRLLSEKTTNCDCAIWSKTAICIRTQSRAWDWRQEALASSAFSHKCSFAGGSFAKTGHSTSTLLSLSVPLQSKPFMMKFSWVVGTTPANKLVSLAKERFLKNTVRRPIKIAHWPSHWLYASQTENAQQSSEDSVVKIEGPLRLFLKATLFLWAKFFSPYLSKCKILALLVSTKVSLQRCENRAFDTDKEHKEKFANVASPD